MGKRDDELGLCKIEVFFDSEVFCFFGFSKVWMVVHLLPKFGPDEPCLEFLVIVTVVEHTFSFVFVFFVFQLINVLYDNFKLYYLGAKTFVFSLNFYRVH